MVAETVDAARFDHMSPEYAHRWREIYAGLRQTCPVARSEAYGGYYVLTRYEDVERAVKDDVTFSSFKDLDPESIFQGIMIPPSPTRSTPIEMDPPEFTPLRKLFNPWFSPGQAKKWAPFVRDVTTAFIDTVIESGRMEVIEDLASPVPALLTGALVGLPLEDWKTYADAAHNIVFLPYTDPRFPKIVEQWLGVCTKATEVALARREDPHDDLISAIAAHRDESGELLSPQIIAEMCSLIISGGNDTTTGLLANAMLWLSEHPDEREWLRAEPARLEPACEELLRYFTPTQGLARTVTRDVEIGGHRLTRGDRVMLSFASANLDPEYFDRPDEVVLDRFPNRHQAFGLGLHRCLGSNYTRMDFVVVMEEVLRRMPDFVVDRSASECYENIGIVNGWVRMPMTFTPGAREGSTFRL